MSVKYKKIEVCNGYYLDRTVLNSIEPEDMYQVVKDCKTELKDFIDTNKKVSNKVSKMNNKAYALLSNKNLRKAVFDLTEDIEDFDAKNNKINEFLKQFGGYGYVLNSYDFWNVNKDIQLRHAKDSLKYLKDLKVKKPQKSLSVEDMLKDLKINSEE